MGYTKLDESLLTSSLWSESDQMLRVWIYLLASAKSDGTISATVPSIARACGYEIEVVEAALERLQRPDRHSRTKVDDGRRIVIEDDPEWCIRLVNYSKYRLKDHTATTRKQRQRERERALSVTRDGVTSHRDIVTVTQAEAEAEAEAEAGTAVPAADAAEGHHGVHPSLVRSNDQQGSSSRELQLTPVEPSRDSWSREAIDMWDARFHSTAPGREIAKHLYALVVRFGWIVPKGDPKLIVKPAWERYIRDKEPEYANAADFAKRFGAWALSKGKSTSKTADAVDAWSESRFGPKA